MKFYITTEATADIPESLSIQFENLAIIPMGFTLNGTTYDGDKTNLTAQEFYSAVKNAQTKEDLPITAMVTTYTAKEFFTPILKEGYDILHVGFSEALSGTYDAISLAIKELKQEFPERKIEIVSSLNASFGEGITVYYAAKKRDAGASFEETLAYAKEIINKVAVYFIVDDIKHLYRTGRASKAAAFAGEMLQIKPILYINKEGRLVPIEKVLSKKKGIRTLYKYFTERMLPVDEQLIVGIGHGDNLTDATLLKSELLESYPSLNVEILDIGPIIGTHTGAGIVGIFFLGTTRVEKKDTTLNNN